MTWQVKRPLSDLSCVSRRIKYTYQLISQKENSLERELPVTEVEEILERGAEKIDDHRIVVAFGSEPSNERNADATGEGLVHLGFVLQLGVLGLDRLQLDGHFFARDDVDPQVDVTCGDDVSTLVHKID